MNKTTVRGWVVQYRHPKVERWSNDVGDRSVSAAVVGRTGVFQSRKAAREFVQWDREEYPQSPLRYRIQRATVTLEIEP